MSATPIGQVITDRGEALNVLYEKVPINVDPVIKDMDLQNILDRCVLATVWLPSTDYAFGARVIPATQNGRKFKCVKPGTSGATEPIWNCAFLERPAMWNADNVPRFTHDGLDTGQVLWLDDGKAPECLWDIRQAVYRGWKFKQSMAVARFQSGAYGTNDAFQQVFDHCVRMANESFPVRVS